MLLRPPPPLPPPPPKKEGGGVYFFKSVFELNELLKIKGSAGPGKFKQASTAHGSLPVNAADWNKIKESCRQLTRVHFII